MHSREWKIVQSLKKDSWKYLFVKTNKQANRQNTSEVVENLNSTINKIDLMDINWIFHPINVEYILTM